MLNHFILNYYGNKYLETKKHFKDYILENNNFDIIIEPFGGIFGFSRAFFELNNNYNGDIWINDIDTEHINFLNKLKNEPENTIDELETEFNNKYGIYDNNYVFKRDKKTLSSLSYALRNIINVNKIPKISNVKNKIQNFKNKINDFKTFLNKVKFFNLDYISFLQLIPKGKKVLLYLDPPYLDSYNKDYDRTRIANRTIEYVDNTKIYIDILERFKQNNDNVKILLVINEAFIIDYLFKEYTFLKYESMYQRKKNIKKIIVYHKS